jgi:integrase/recombinase XerD
MATFKPILKPNERADKTHLVMLRITVDRKLAHLSTGIYLPKKDWNPKATLDKSNWVRTSNRMCEAYNTAIRDLLQEAQTLALSGDHDAATLKKLLTQGEDKPCFLKFFASELVRIKKESTPRTHEKYTNIYSRLSTYAGTSLPFEQITVAWVKKYESHLLEKNKRNTASKHLSFVKTIMLRAVAEGTVSYADNPFLHFKLKSEKPDKARLTKEELDRIIALDLPQDKRIHHARVAFLLQFFLAGMRIGDLLQMRWEMVRGSRIEYRSQKTNTPLAFEISPRAMELIEPFRKKRGYILPFIPEGLKEEAIQKKVESMTAIINKNLPAIAKLAEIDKKLTTHIARHTFASIAWARTRDLKAVSEALGHRKISMTENYLRGMLGAEFDDFLGKVFDDF